MVGESQAGLSAPSHIILPITVHNRANYHVLALCYVVTLQVCKMALGTCGGNRYNCGGYVGCTHAKACLSLPILAPPSDGSSVQPRSRQ